MKDIKVIFFDFDGVIIDSMPVRDFGFREIFKEYDKRLVDKLIEYHRLNGGLSRFVKIKYFYEVLLKKSITENEIIMLANKFSKIMRIELSKKEYLITETVEFIKKLANNYQLYIVSGSEDNELNFLCNKLEISQYFKEIKGSPTSKDILIKKILKKDGIDKNRTVMIGDAINDYEAAAVNKLKFYGYNNEKIKNIGNMYIQRFRDLVIENKN